MKRAPWQKSAINRLEATRHNPLPERMSAMNDKTTAYDDIIHLPHHVSTTHPQMSIYDRAAQFAPFAALTGHGEAIRETARLTDEKIQLDEQEKSLLDERLRMVQDMLTKYPEITVTYFRPDQKKSGGEYISVTGCIKKIDGCHKLLSMSDGLQIPLDDIFKIEGAIFGTCI